VHGGQGEGDCIGPIQASRCCQHVCRCFGICAVDLGLARKVDQLIVTLAGAIDNQIISAA
jgi:hypothetical protein